MQKYCYECGKKITFWKSQFHPVRGKKVRVCPQCFDVVLESLEKYQAFVLNDLDNHGMLKKEIDVIPNILAFQNLQNHKKKSDH